VGTPPAATALLAANKVAATSLTHPPAIQTAPDASVTSPPPLRAEPTGQAQAVQAAASGTTGLPTDLPSDISKQHQTIPSQAGATAEGQQHGQQQATEEQAQEPMMQTPQAEKDQSSLSAKKHPIPPARKNKLGKTSA